MLSSRKAIELAERYPQIYASVGIHPNSASQEHEDFLSELDEMVKHPKVVAVGETGLDYYRLASKQEESEVSQTAFGAASFTTIENEIRDEAEIAAQSATFEQHQELAAAAGKNRPRRSVEGSGDWRLFEIRYPVLPTVHFSARTNTNERLKSLDI